MSVPNYSSGHCWRDKGNHTQHCHFCLWTLWPDGLEAQELCNNHSLTASPQLPNARNIQDNRGSVHLNSSPRLILLQQPPLDVGVDSGVDLKADIRVDFGVDGRVDLRVDLGADFGVDLRVNFGVDLRVDFGVGFGVDLRVYPALPPQGSATTTPGLWHSHFSFLSFPSSPTPCSLWLSSLDQKWVFFIAHCTSCMHRERSAGHRKKRACSTGNQLIRSKKKKDNVVPTLKNASLLDQEAKQHQNSHY